MIKSLPLTSLIVLNTLCPCRKRDAKCCGVIPAGHVTKLIDYCCTCHRLTWDREGFSLTAPECQWPLHAVINGHAEFEASAIRLIRECLSASVPFESGPAVWSKAEGERLQAMPAFLREFLGED